MYMQAKVPKTSHKLCEFVACKNSYERHNITIGTHTVHVHKHDNDMLWLLNAHVYYAV